MRNFKSVLTIFATLLLTACSAPIQNIYNASAHAERHRNTIHSVRKAIFRAGKKTHWKMRLAKSNKIIAMHAEDDRRAVVTISFNRYNYNITYKDSYRLSQYHQSISKLYNQWVQTLNEAIQQQLAKK